MIQNYSYLTVLLLVLLKIGCSSSPMENPSESVPSKKQQSSRAQELPPEDTSLEIDQNLNEREKNYLQKIKRAYEQKDFTQALLSARQFLLQFPQSTAVSQVYNFQGLSHYQLKQNDEAVFSFKNGLRSSKGKKMEAYLQFNLASTLHEKELYQDVVTESLSVNYHSLDPLTRFKFYRLMFYNYKKLSQPEKAIESLFAAEKSLQLIAASSEGDPRTYLIKIEEPLHEVLTQINQLPLLKNYYETHQDSFFKSVFLFRLGEFYFKSRDFKEAEPLFVQFRDSFQESPFFRQVTDYLRTLEGQNQINPQNLGVLLPMTGKFAPFGLQTLNGIEHALRVYEESAPDRGFKIIVEDSGETKEQTLEALDRLFFHHKVVAVIGPLLSRGINEVTQRAQDLGVPLISLSQQRGITADYVFYASVTPQDQAEEIARVAIEQQKMKKFAILYPKEKFGESLANSFWNTVQSLGGEVVAIESYAPNEPDFREAVDKLVGLHYQSDRKLKFQELERLRAKDKITKKTPKTESYYKLPPLVEFDAIFIPDEAKSVAQALPTFTYRDADQVRFLGISTWNSPLLIERAQKEAQHSYFVDTFYPGVDQPQTKKFYTSFKQVFGYAPSATEAFAYDAASILEKALLVLGSSAQRSSVRKLFSELDNHRGVTGTISTTKEGILKRPLKVLTVKRNEVVSVD